METCLHKGAAHMHNVPDDPGSGMPVFSKQKLGRKHDVRAMSARSRSRAALISLWISM